MNFTDTIKLKILYGKFDRYNSECIDYGFKRFQETDFWETFHEELNKIIEMEIGSGISKLDDDKRGIKFIDKYSVSGGTGLEHFHFHVISFEKKAMLCDCDSVKELIETLKVLKDEE